MKTLTISAWTLFKQACSQIGVTKAGQAPEYIELPTKEGDHTHMFSPFVPRPVWMIHPYNQALIMFDFILMNAVQ
jgi:hypothetical protein